MTEQTEREAFEAWRITFRGPWRGLPTYADVWQAACAWQRERDAQVCEASGYADAAADAIRAQGER